MTDVLWYAILAPAGGLALYLIVRFPKRRWPRPMAVTSAGGIIAILLGEAGAVPAILSSGIVLTVCAASTADK